jgi:hypothetical protein
MKPNVDNALAFKVFLKYNTNMSKIRIIIAGFITLIMGGVVVAIILMFIHAASFLNIIYLMVGIILIEIVFSIYIINSRRHIYTKLS